MTEKTNHEQPTILCARSILRAFDEYCAKFKAITQRARGRFEDRDWQGAKADAEDRLDLYKEAVDRIVAEVRRLLNNRVNEKEVWVSIKAAYSELSGGLDVWELAETFFNSVTRKIFDTVGVDPQVEFVDTCIRLQPLPLGRLPRRTFEGNRSIPALIEEILSDYKHRPHYEDMRRDARLVAEYIEGHLRSDGRSPHLDRVEMLTCVFYRGKGAYLIGRILSDGDALPLVLALLNNPEGIVVDAVLLTEDEISILFSFTRSYFHVDIEQPLELVSFLKSVIPRKRIAELYISIGYNKHGKSELYCDLLHHLSRSDEKFEIAEGARGMVMEVFTMPDYDLVFKVIKDHFAFPKNSTREAVMGKYYLVFKHDRAGRLVDAQEFEHLKFKRNRFSEELLDSLKRNASRTVTVYDDVVVVGHAYVERRVTPLNIYIKEVDEAEAQSAIVDYGNAIKDLAVTNIFPGDILLKNFGVTRHGRVVFYDYDELCLLSICNFRVIPQPRTYEDELSSEPWFAVEKNDVFPEEFRNFMGLIGTLRDVFMEHHGDLFEVDFWRRTQSSIKAGEIIDIFPYGQGCRIMNRKAGVE